MTTKNLVPRLDGQGKLGVKGASNLKWKEVNALSGSFDLGQIDDLQNQDGNDLIVGGTGVTVTHASGSNGFEYTIASTVDLTGYATENYVNDAIQGLDAKEAVDAATTGSLSGYVYASNVFTESSATGALTIDGFVLSNGDRVLVKDQGSGNEVQHGIYVVSNIDNSSAVTLTRAPDITHDDTDADDFDGAFVFVLNGTDQIGRSYVAKPTTAGQTTVGTHGMSWVTFTSSNVTTLNTLSDVNASSAAGIDGYSLVYNHSNTQWEASEIVSAGSTVLLDSNNVSQIFGTNRAEISVTAGTTYIIDESVDGIQFLNDLVFVLPNADVNDPSTTKIINLTSLPVFVYIDTGNRLYDALGNPATSGSASGKTGFFFRYTKGTINLYQSDISTTNAKWYSYFDYPINQSADQTEGDGISYSVQDKSFINAGHVYGDYVLTADVTQTLIRSGRKYVTTYDESIARTVTFGNPYDHSATIDALDGHAVYFENRGTSTLTIDKDTGPYSGGVYYRTQIFDFDGTLNNAAKVLAPGESAVVVCEHDTSVSNINLFKLYFQRNGHVPNRTTETITSTSTVSIGTEHHKVVYVDNGSTAIAITVPVSSTIRDGYQLTFKARGTATVTINRSSTDTFDSSTSLTLSQNDQLALIKSDSGWAILQSGAVSGITEVSQDSSPQLGGDLDLNSHDLVTTADTDLELAPHGTGIVVLKGNQIGGNNPGAIKFNCEQNSHGVTIKSPDHSSNANYTLTLPINDGDADQVLKTDGSGGLDWVDQSSGGATTLDGLSDVDTSTAPPTDGQVLAWNNTDSEWQPSDVVVPEKTKFITTYSAIHNITLNDLTRFDNWIYAVPAASVPAGETVRIDLVDPASLVPNSGDTVSINISRHLTEGGFNINCGITSILRPRRLNSDLGLKNSIYVESGEFIKLTAVNNSGTVQWYVEDDTTQWTYTEIDSTIGIGQLQYQPGRLYDISTAFSVSLLSDTFRKGKPVLFRNSDASNSSTISAGGSRTIEGSSSFSLKAGKHIEMLPDSTGTNMHILNKLNRLVDVGTSTPTDGQALAWSSSASEWQPTTISGGASTLGGLSDVTLTSPSDNSVLTYDSGSSSWIDGQSLSLSGNIITSANIQADELQFVNTNNKLYMNQFANNVGTDLDSSQASAVLLVNKPLVVRPMSDDTLTILGRGDNEGGGGTGIKFYDKGDSSGLNRNYIKIKAPDAKLNASYTLTLPADDGSANQVLETDGNGGLSWTTPAGGGSVPNVTSASPSSAYTITTHAGIEEIYLLTPTANVTATIPSAAAAGLGYKYNIKNLSATYTLTVKASTSPQETIDGQGTFDLSTQYSSITIVSDGSNWHII